MTNKIVRIGQIAIERPNEVFTSIYHLINRELLLECFNELNMIDKNIGNDYRVNLDNLVFRLRNKSYRLNFIEYEDKIIQLALYKLLNAIFEPKFSNSMFCFGQKGNCHDALKRVKSDIEKSPTNYVVKMDINSLFDNIDYNRLLEYLKMYIKDYNVLRLVRMFLKAGILDDDGIYMYRYVLHRNILGSFLIDIYVYYTLVKWFEDFVKVKYDGFISIIYSASNVICCFQYENVAKLFCDILFPNRIKQLNLSFLDNGIELLKIDRDVLMENNVRKSDTFEFLGFVYYCNIDKNGRFCIKYRMSSKVFSKELVYFNHWCKENRNESIDTIMRLYKRYLMRYYSFYGIGDNYYMMCKYYYRTLCILFKWINRRSQRRSYDWKEFLEIVKKYDTFSLYVK